MVEIAVGVGVFTAIVLVPVALILLARIWLVPSGEVSISVNGERRIRAPVGVKLSEALARCRLCLSTACGGGGTCGRCRVKVLEGGGALLPTETAHISKREAAAGDRLSCQVTVRQDLRVQVPREVFGVRRWECTVRSNGKLGVPQQHIMLDDFGVGGR